VLLIAFPSLDVVKTSLWMIYGKPFHPTTHKNIFEVKLLQPASRRQLKFMALFCLPFLIAGSALTIHEVSFQITGAHAKGTIVRWETDDTSSAVFEFIDARTGQKIMVKNPLSGGSYRVGDTVDVIYDPNNPRSAQINDIRNLLFALAFTSMFGFVEALMIFSIKGRIRAWTASSKGGYSESGVMLPPFTRIGYRDIGSSLEDGEMIVWTGKPTRSRFPWQFLAFIPLLLGLFVVFMVIDMGWSPSIILPSLVVPSLFIVFVAGMGFSFMRNTEYAVTNRRAIARRGSIMKLETSVEFGEIEDVHVKVNIVDRIFGTGGVIVTAGGFDILRFTALKEPYDVEELIREGMERAGNSKTHL